MTAPDLARPHVVVGPHEYAEARWWGMCICGEEFFGLSAESVREKWQPHRDAGRRRLSEVEPRRPDVG